MRIELATLWDINYELWAKLQKNQPVTGEVLVHMPRDKNTTSLGKARGGPRRTTRLDHREVVMRPWSPTQRRERKPIEEEPEEKEAEAKDLSVTASVEEESDGSDAGEAAEPLDSTGSVTPVDTPFEGEAVLANVVTEEELQKLNSGAQVEKKRGKGVTGLAPEAPKPKTTPLRVSALGRVRLTSFRYCATSVV